LNKSPSIKELAAALVKAQAELKNPAFDSTNPHFKSKFASLAAVREAVLPVLNKHGLAITQFPVSADEHSGVHNLLMHVSGEWIEEACLLPLDKNNAQGAGSAVTYARRYSLQAIAGVVADEDDDANAASAPVKKEAKQPTTPAALEVQGTLSKAAHKGTQAFREAWKGLTQEQRKLVPESVMADLKALCDETDSELATQA
jgi:hypothetical protein